MIYGRPGELIKSLNRMPGSITTAITALYGRRMATNTFLSACLSVEPPDCLSHFFLCFFLFLLPPSHSRFLFLLTLRGSTKRALERATMNVINLHGYSSTELGVFKLYTAMFNRRKQWHVIFSVMGFACLLQIYPCCRCFILLI